MSPWLISLCYCLAIYGASNIIAFGSGPFRIFERIRFWAGKISDHFALLFSCMMCLPTNLGLIASIVSTLCPVKFTPFTIVFASAPHLWWIALVLDAALSSGFVWVMHHMVEFFEKVIDAQEVVIEDDENEKTIYADDITKK